MKRISKKVREEAALICSAAASCREPISILSTIPSFGASARGHAARLALSAWQQGWDSSVDNHDNRARLCAAYAEAECLLRTGWSP